MFTYIDWFCGIGGFRQAAEANEFKCVFAYEPDPELAKTYYDNFKTKPEQDVEKINFAKIPEADILTVSFPGLDLLTHSYEDQNGGLKNFYQVLRLVREKYPSFVVFEYLPDLLRYENTFSHMLCLLKEAGYVVEHSVLNAVDFGIPQTKERLFIVGIREDKFLDLYSIPLGDIDGPEPKVLNILDKLVPAEEQSVFLQDKYLPTLKYLNKPIHRYKRSLRLGQVANGSQGERIYGVNAPGITVSPSSGGPGRQTGLYLVNDKIRRLTYNEVRKMTGFPATFKINETPAKGIRQFAQSVIVPVASEIFVSLMDYAHKAWKIPRKQVGL